MATQAYGYGPNVWAAAKPLGAQQFARLQQPGAVAPQFKAENKYKALAAKAIGEMAYGAMMNQEAKKKKAEERALTQSLYGDTFEALSGKSGDFMFQPFESSVVPTEKDETNTDKTNTGTKSTETTNSLSDMSGKPKGDSFVEKDNRGISGTWNWIEETKPARMPVPAWNNKIAGGYVPTGKWVWGENKYTGNISDYKIGDRISKAGQVYQAIEGLNGQITWTPVY